MPCGDGVGAGGIAKVGLDDREDGAENQRDRLFENERRPASPRREEAHRAVRFDMPPGQTGRGGRDEPDGRIAIGRVRAEQIANDDSVAEFELPAKCGTGELAGGQLTMRETPSFEAALVKMPSPKPERREQQKSAAANAAAEQAADIDMDSATAPDRETLARLPEAGQMDDQLAGLEGDFRILVIDQFAEPIHGTANMVLRKMLKPHFRNSFSARRHNSLAVAPLEQ